MPPQYRTARARAKAQAAAMERKNNKRQLRRQAAQALAKLATDLHVPRSIDAKDPRAEDVEGLVRLLERRVQTPAHRQQLFAAAKQWEDNGGGLSAPVLQDAMDRPCVVHRHRVLQPNFKLQSKAFMLVYNGDILTPASWPALRSFVESLAGRYGARAWAACVERSLHSPFPGRHHAHAYLLWTDGVGVSVSNLADFYFDGIRPRIEVCVARGKQPHDAACHGLWYVALMKDGTVASASNYEAGVDYKPRADWLQNLYKDKKLTHHEYLAMSARDFPLGHSARKRDAEEAFRDARRAAVRALVATELQLLRNEGRYFQPRSFPEVEEFLACFGPGGRWRRPVLLIIGATHLGKTMLAASVLERIARLLGVRGFIEVTVEEDAHLDLSELDVREHAGALLDGVSDTLTLKKHRETLQGRPKVSKGARTATMKFSYDFTLARRAVLATMDLSAQNLSLLKTDHWLSDKRNVLQLHLTQPAWLDPARPPEAAPVAAPPRSDLMRAWRVPEVAAFLEGEDLAGPAIAMRTNGVAGSDFVDLSVDVMLSDLRLTRFAAAKVVAARDRFLQDS